MLYFLAVAGNAWGGAAILDHGPEWPAPHNSQMNTARFPVIVLGSGLTGIGVIRSLGRAGHEVYSICGPNEPPTQSRWCRPFPKALESRFIPGRARQLPVTASASARRPDPVFGRLDKSSRRTSGDSTRAVPGQHFPRVGDTHDDRQMAFCGNAATADVPRPKTLWYVGRGMAALPEQL